MIDLDALERRALAEAKREKDGEWCNGVGFTSHQALALINLAKAVEKLFDTYKVYDGEGLFGEVKEALKEITE